MMRTAFSFVRLSRPVFLLGGLLLHGLGALVARYVGLPIDPVTFALGQLAVTSAQLMTHYLNELADIESDALNRRRTFWTGGSGVLTAGLIRPEIAWVAARVGLAVSLSAMLALGALRPVGWQVWTVYALALAGAWSYSGPPVRLETTGFGELVAATVVAVLTPVLGYTLQAGTPGSLILLSTLPLAALQLAMLLVFEFPDRAADAAGGKATLLVRAGPKRGGIAAVTAMALAYALLGASRFGGVPAQVAAAGLVTLPLALVQGLLMLRIANGRAVPYGWFTFGGVALFALTGSAVALAYWVIG